MKQKDAKKDSIEMPGNDFQSSINKIAVSRVKTFDEINREKEAALRKQKEKSARERQLVLDNIHLLRLQEMFPDANIQMPEDVSYLVEAYLRRNMVSTELKEEVALIKLLSKKPRPFEII